MTNTLEIRRKRIRIRAWRRGFKEADLILGRYADLHLDSMEENQISQFEDLLDQEDQDVYGWIIDRIATPSKFDGSLMAALKAFKVSEFASCGDGPQR
jgi:antitoxin CptB